jgi:hypothetical protein
MAPLRWARFGVRAARAIVGALSEASRDVVDQLSCLTLSVYASYRDYVQRDMSRGVLSISSWVLSGDDFQTDHSDVFVALDSIALPAALEIAPGLISV